MPFNFPLSPPQASSFAGEYDAIFYALCALTLIFSVIVFGAVIYFTAKYRRGSAADRSRPIYEDLRLELGWTITPLVLGLVMFFLGANLFVKMRTPPENAQEIYVIGKRWMWHAQHAASGVRENNTLHVPMGRDIKLTMISQDVIHAFYIPAFRTQMMVVPGRYTTMWFRPTKVGQYHLFCNMYCGTQHSEMGGKVIVMEPKDYARWVANGGNSQSALTMEESGARLFKSLGCNNCHGGSDTLRGPTLRGIHNTNRPTSVGMVKADEAYLRESILTPWQKLTKGYSQSMPQYANDVTEEQVLSLIAYIKASGARSVPAIPSPVVSSSLNTSGASSSQGSVGAIQYQTEFSQGRVDPTPTTRKNAPAVGATAYQQNNP